MRQRTQGGRVAEHFRQRHQRADDLAAATGNFIHALHHAAPRRQVAHGVAHELFRRLHLDLHHRFQQDRVGTAHAFLERHRTGHAECVFVRIDVVVRTEGERYLDIDHRVAGQHAAAQGFLHAFIDGRDELARHHAALDRIDELEAFTGLERFERQHHVAVLAASARLLDELALDIRDGFLDRLAVRHLRLADRRFHAEFAAHAIDQDFQVQLAHAGHDGLARLFVRMDAERRILLRQAIQGDAHFFLVGLGLRFHRLRNHGLGEDHLFQHDHVVGRTQCIARGHAFQTDGRRDIAGIHFLDLLALVGVHLQDAAQPLFLRLGRVIDGVARIDHARVHAEKRQLAHERIGHDLERQRRERIAVGRMALDRPVLLVGAGNGGHVHRRRQVFDHGVEHGLHAAVFKRAASEHRHDFVADGAQAQAGLDLVFGQRLAFEVLVEQLGRGFGRRFHQLVAPFLRLRLQVGRNVLVRELHAQALVVPVNRAHFHQVDHAVKIVLGAERQLDRHRHAFQAVGDLFAHAQKIGADAVHLVDEGDARHLVLVGLAPHGFRLRLHAAHRVIHHDGAVEHAHRALDFDGEVDVARGVDDVDAVLGKVAGHAFPERRGGGGRDGDAAFLLLLHPVHGGRAVVYLADFVIDAGIKQDTLGGGGFAGVDVSADADIAIALDRGFAGHHSSSYTTGLGSLRCGAHGIFQAVKLCPNVRRTEQQLI